MVYTPIFTAVRYSYRQSGIRIGNSEKTMSSKPRPLKDIAPGTSLLTIPVSLSLLACLMLAATLTIDFAAFRGTFTFPVWL